MIPTEPTLGEIYRRFDRFEIEVRNDLHEIRDRTVPTVLWSVEKAQIMDEITDLQTQLEAQRVTKRQLLIGAFLLLMGEILAVIVALAGITP